VRVGHLCSSVVILNRGLCPVRRRVTELSRVTCVGRLLRVDDLWGDSGRMLGRVLSSGIGRCVLTVRRKKGIGWGGV
jgi:hypothetical protein